jgi:hypothetical protein
VLAVVVSPTPINDVEVVNAYTLDRSSVESNWTKNLLGKNPPGGNPILLEKLIENTS